MSRFKTPILQGCNYKSFLQYDTSHWTVNGVNFFWGLFPNMHQYHAISLQLTQGSFLIFFLFSSQHAVQNSSTVFYTVVLQGTIATGHFLQNTWQHSVHDAYFVKALQINTFV